MASRSDLKPPRGKGAVDPDGIVRTKIKPDRRRRLPFFFLLLTAMAGLAIVPLWLFLLRAREAPGHPDKPSSQHITATSSARPSRAIPIVNRPHPASTGDGAATDSDEEGEPPRAEVAASSAREGIYAFPAPGTKRIKVGIVVPDDFELPPGYVRHYQATDKGEMLPAILMFHPLTPPLDARGDPVEVPADRIVPADMAPPGLPVEMLRVPDDAYADPNDPGQIPADVNHQGAGDSDP